MAATCGAFEVLFGHGQEVWQSENLFQKFGKESLTVAFSLICLRACSAAEDQKKSMKNNNGFQMQMPLDSQDSF